MFLLNLFYAYQSSAAAYVLPSIVRGIILFLELLGYVLIASALLSWFLRPDHGLRRFLSALTAPIVYPFRKLSQALIRRGLMLDISVLLAYIAIQILRSLVVRLYIYLMML